MTGHVVLPTLCCVVLDAVDSWWFLSIDVWLQKVCHYTEQTLSYSSVSVGCSTQLLVFIHRCMAPESLSLYRADFKYGAKTMFVSRWIE